MKETIKQYLRVSVGITKIRYTWLVILLSVFSFIYGIADTSKPLGNPIWIFATVTFFIASIYLLAWLQFGSIHQEGFSKATKALRPYLKARKGEAVILNYARPMDYHGTPDEVPVDRYFMAGVSLAIQDFHKTRKAA